MIKARRVPVAYQTLLNHRTKALNDASFVPP